MVLADAGLSSGVEIFVVFVGAAFGSAFAVGLQAYVTRRGSKRYYQSLMRALTEEISHIRVAAADRASRSLADLRLDPPYATLAWETFVRSPEIRRLEARYESFAEFYGNVFEANHRLAQVATLLQTSAMASSDELRVHYLELAQTFPNEASARLVTQATALLSSAETS